MREVTLKQLKSMAQHDYSKIWAKARGLNRDPKIYVHWTAGRYMQLFDDYHVLITGDGRVYVSTDDLSETMSSTYMRNTGSISIALCCAYNATGINDLGDYPPTPAQMNAVAQVICVLADALDLTIDLQRVMTHAEAADNKDGMHTHEPYGPDSTVERWDLLVVNEGDDAWSGGNIIRGNANWWRGQRLLR